MYIQPINNNKLTYNKSLNKGQPKKNIIFQARVDKGLERFYSFNKDRMPLNVLKFINGLKDKSQLTPLEVQKQAYIALEDKSIRSVDDVKNKFSDEPLFQNLKDPLQVGSKQGILYLMKKLDGDLRDLGITPLKNGENLTVYLVKKIFLEAKTIKEINEDMDNDLDDLFKSEYKRTNPEAPYITSVNFATLGIKFPNKEYINSLKFTRTGYSDKFAELISIAQKMFWESLSENERTARAKKSVAKFENWWLKKSHDEKLEMIAQQNDTLDLLKDFKASTEQKSNLKKLQAITTIEQSNLNNGHVKIGSNTLKQDDLFKLWATNNLKIFEENLSEEDKIKINEKRMRNQATYWREMTESEKADYVSKMKTGSEIQRYVMVEAWNNSFDLLKKLSDFMSERKIKNIEEFLFSKDKYSMHMSAIMTDFWAQYPEEAQEFGNAISNAWQKINCAIANNQFEQLKTEVSQKRKQRTDEIRIYKNNKLRNIEENNVSTKLLYRSIKDMYLQNFQSLAKQNNIFIINELTNEMIASLTDEEKEFLLNDENKKKFLEYSAKGLNYPIPENIDISLKTIFRSINYKLYANVIKITGAYDSAANIIMTENVLQKEGNTSTTLKEYLYNFIIAGQHFGKSNDKIINKLSKEMNNKKNYYTSSRFLELYNRFKEPITDEEIEEILKKYFKAKKAEDLEPYRNIMKLYGKYVQNIFSENSPFPIASRIYMYQNMIMTMPYLSPTSPDAECECLLENTNYITNKNIRNFYSPLIEETFPFLPKDFKQFYIDLTSKLDDKSFKDWYDFFVIVKESEKSSDDSYVNMPTYPRDKMNLKDKIKFLAMDTALADTLYEHCKSNIIYGFELESLMPILGLYYTQRNSKGSLINTTSLIFDFSKSQPRYNYLQARYKYYLNECNKWLKSDKTNKDEALEDLLFILNPDDNNSERDEEILKKLDKYNIQNDI